MSDSFDKITIKFLNKDLFQDNWMENKLTQLVRTEFKSFADPKANYDSIKFETIKDEDGNLNKLMMYITHKDIYLFETLELSFDPTGKLIGTKKI